MSSEIQPSPGKLIYIRRPDSQPHASEEACGSHVITLVRGDKFKVDGFPGWFDAEWIGNSLDGFLVGIDDRRDEADDRTLLALGEKLAAALAAEIPVMRNAHDLHGKWSAEMDRLGLDGKDVAGSDLRELRKRQRELSIEIGYDAAAEAWSTASCNVALLCRAINVIPVNTVAGLAIKGQALLYDALEFGCDETIDSLEDGDRRRVMLFVREIERVAKNAAACQLREVA